jgi:hypothetical protein
MTDKYLGKKFKCRAGHKESLTVFDKDGKILPRRDRDISSDDILTFERIVNRMPDISPPIKCYLIPIEDDGYIAFAVTNMDKAFKEGTYYFIGPEQEEVGIEGHNRGHGYGNSPYEFI